MKKEKLNIKKIIKAKIDFQQAKNNNVPILKSKVKPIAAPDGSDLSKLSKRDRGFALNNPNIEYRKKQDELILQYRDLYEKIKIGGFERIYDVDYETIICISSYNRFDKVDKLLSMFYDQISKYSYKILLLDDCSSDERYKSLVDKYPNLLYRKNQKNNGRKLYWYTVTQLWQWAKEYKTNTLLMIDDDFVLGNNFLDTLIDFYYYIKQDNNNVIGIAPHLHSYALNVQQMEWWYNTFSVDGVGLFDRNFIESFDYRLEIVTDEELNAQAHAHGWSQIQKKIQRDNKMVYKTKYSLVYHDGNDESRLGSNNIKKSKAYTYFFKADGVNYLDLIV